MDGIGVHRRLNRLHIISAQIDQDPIQVRHIQALASQLAPALPQTNFHVGSLDALPYDDNFFDGRMGTLR